MTPPLANIFTMENMEPRKFYDLVEYRQLIQEYLAFPYSLAISIRNFILRCVLILIIRKMPHTNFRIDVSLQEKKTGKIIKQ